jgi:hypothetical protein
MRQRDKSSRDTRQRYAVNNITVVDIVAVALHWLEPAVELLEPACPVHHLPPDGWSNLTMPDCLTSAATMQLIGAPAAVRHGVARGDLADSLEFACGERDLDRIAALYAAKLQSPEQTFQSMGIDMSPLSV